MKLTSLITVLLLLWCSSFANPIKFGKYYGEGEDGWDSSRLECSVNVKSGKNEDQIRVKSSYAKIWHKAYVLNKDEDYKYVYNDVVGKSGVIVEAEFNENGKLIFFSKTVLTDIMVTHTVMSSWCEINWIVLSAFQPFSLSIFNLWVEIFLLMILVHLLWSNSWAQKIINRVIIF